MEQNEKEYPSREECLTILNRQGCPEHVIQHILAVTDLALKIGSRFPMANIELIEAGSLLHDLGRARTHGIDHAVEGGKLALKLGLNKKIVHIIERHICAGITKDDAVLLGLPPKDYTPKTLEEKIVAHADNLFEGNTRCNIERAVQILKEKGLPKVAYRVQQLHFRLSKEAGIDIDEI